MLSTGNRWGKDGVSKPPDFTMREWVEAHNFLCRLGVHKNPIAVPKLKGGVE